MKKFRLYGTDKIPKKKQATADFLPFETNNLEELVKYVNTHAIIPCELKPITKEQKNEPKRARVTIPGSGYRLKENKGEVYGWIRLDVDAEGEAKKIDKVLKDMFYIKKPSTSNDKYPYKWHYLIPIENVTQNYDGYKLQYYAFLSDMGIKLQDKRMNELTRNMNPYGAGGEKLTVVNEGKVWVAKDVKAPKQETTNTNKKKHSNISMGEMKKILANLPESVKNYESGGTLAKGDNGIGYDDFKRIGFALYDWCPKRGLKLWHGLYDDSNHIYKDQIDTSWDDFSKGGLKGDVTVGTLLHMAHGEKKESGDIFTKEKGEVSVKFSKAEIKENKMQKKAYEKQEGKLEYDPKDFPKGIREYMIDATQEMGLNFSAAVPYTFMMLSQMIGGGVKIKMKNKWTHAPVIWGMNIAGAGVGKSPLIKKLSAPIWNMQIALKNKYERDMTSYKLEMGRFLRDVKQGSVRPEDEPKKPIMKMVIMDEFTPEALYDQLEDNRDGIMVWKDELKGMFLPDKQTDVLRTKMISAWSGNNITRNTKTQGVNILVDPYVRVGGNVQPEVIKDILKKNNSGFNADGFIVRFQLVAHLKEIDSEWDYESNLFARDSFLKACKKIAKNEDEKLLIFDAEGATIVKNYMEQLKKDKIDATSNFEREYLAKLGSLFGSVMVILHVLKENSKELVISSQTIRTAINITETARDNAFHLYGIEKRDKVEKDNADILIKEWLKSKTGKNHLGKKGLKRSAVQIRESLAKKVTTQQVVEYFENSKKFTVMKQGRGHNITAS